MTLSDLTLMISLPFGLDLFEQFGFRSLQVVREFYSGFQSIGINLESFSQLLCRRIVKKGNVLVEIRHDQLVTQFLVTCQRTETPANYGFKSSDSHQCFGVEQLNTAGL